MAWTVGLFGSGLVCPVCLSFPCCRTLPSRCPGTWPVRGPAFRRCSDAFARDNCLPVQCRFVASLAGMFFSHKGDFFEGGWLSSNGEMLFVFFFLAFWLADTPSVSRSSPFSILFARRFAVWNKFSGANFHFRMFVVALCVSVVFCLGFCIRMWCVVPETVLRKFSPCQVSFLRVAVGNKFSGANFCFLLFVLVLCFFCGVLPRFLY